MRIDAVTLRVVSLPLRFVFKTSFDTVDRRTALLVTLQADGLEGWGECVADVAPAYSSETTATAMHVLVDSLVPAMLGKEFANVEALWACMGIVRGHPMAKAALENAWLDLHARRLDMPLSRLLGGVRDLVAVGVSLGIQSTVAATLDLVEAHIAEGYRRIKLKIEPGWDVEAVEAVRHRWPDLPLSVDANAAYTLADAAVLRRLDAFALDYIEQPLAFDDLHDHAKLQRMLATPICLDESITSPQSARQALELDACRIINIKIGRVGGHLQARRIHDIAAAFGAPVWCGGMLETGIGRAHNIAISTLDNFTRPGDVASARRYWTEDIIDQDLQATNGLMPVPAGAGTGVSVARSVLERVMLETREIRP